MPVTWLEAEPTVQAASSVNERVIADEPESTIINHFIRKTPIVSLVQTCEEVIKLFAETLDCECVVVNDEKQRPRGLVMKNRLMIIQTHRFGRELFYSRSIAKIMDHHPLIIDHQVSTQELLDLALGRGERTLYDCVIVTEEERFIGILTMADLLHISRLLQRQSVESQIRTIRGAEAMIQEIDHSVVDVHKAAQLGETMSEAMLDLTLKGKSELTKVTAAFRISRTEPLSRKVKLESFKNGQAPSAKYPNLFVSWQISVIYLPLMQPLNPPAQVNMDEALRS